MFVPKISVNNSYQRSSNDATCNNRLSFGRRPVGTNSALNELVNTPFIKPFARSLAGILSPKEFKAFMAKVKDLTPKIISIRGYEGTRQMFSISGVTRETKGTKPYTVYTAAVKARNLDKGYTSFERKLELNNGIFQSRLSSGKNIAKKLLEACQSAAM